MTRNVLILGVSVLAATTVVVAFLVYSSWDDSQPSPAVAVTDEPQSAGADLEASERDAVHSAGQDAGEKERREPVMNDAAVEQARRIKNLPLGLTEASSDELRGILTDSAQPATLRNIIANRLGEVEDKELPSALRQMLFDETEWPKWRGYCVQQLHECYLREQESDACLDAIFKATGIDVPSVRGTAIWNLALITTSRQKDKRPPAEKTARIRQEVMKVLGEKDAAEEVTLAAVVAAGQMAIAEALPAVRAVVAAEKTSKPFRLRAVTVLGKLGDETDLELLEKIRSNGSARLKKVVATAINRIKTRGEVEKPGPPAPADEPRPEETKF